MSDPQFKKPSEMTLAPTLAEDALLVVTIDPSGTPTTNTVTKATLFANVAVSRVRALTANTLIVPVANTPLSNAARTVGEISWDASYIYVTVANGVTKRAALSTY